MPRWMSAPLGVVGLLAGPVRAHHPALDQRVDLGGRAGGDGRARGWRGTVAELGRRRRRAATARAEPEDEDGERGLHRPKLRRRDRVRQSATVRRSAARAGRGDSRPHGDCEPTVAQLEAYARAAPDDKPIATAGQPAAVPRDLLEYGAGGPTDVTGRSAYQRYSKSAMPLVWEVGGQALWMEGPRRRDRPEGEAWDEVVLVYYPSRAAFVRMVRSDAYREIMLHRTAALADSRLIETSAVRLPRWLLGAARGLRRARALVRPAIPR